MGTVRWALFAVLGVPFVVWRSVVAQKQADTAEQSHITDQINKAVAGLGAEKTVSFRGRFVSWARDIDGTIARGGFMQRWGEGPDIKKRLPEDLAELDDAEIEHGLSFGDWQDVTETVPNIEVRVGAIYALERIAQDSDRDHVQIMEILTAYLKNNSPASSAIPSPEKIMTQIQAYEWAQELPEPRLDIQTAISVIGRRGKEQRLMERRSGFQLNISRTNLQRINFEGTDFSSTSFFRSNLSGAYLSNANFSNSNLNYVTALSASGRKFDIHGSRAEQATFTASNFRELYANEGLDATGADFRLANLIHSVLDKSNFSSADISEATGFDDISAKGTIFAATDFSNTRLQRLLADDTTVINTENLQGTCFCDCDLSSINNPLKSISKAFGDFTVKLPPRAARPEHWPSRYEGTGNWDEWQKWLEAGENYSPPQDRGSSDKS